LSRAVQYLLCSRLNLSIAGHTLLVLFYLLILEQVLQGLRNLWDGLNWLRLAQRRSVTHSGFYAPRVAVFCPVKGTEPDLEQNLAALASFDYPDYEVFFSMASIEDPARRIIDRLVANSKTTATGQTSATGQPPVVGKHKVHTVIAGRPDGCGEKVNNLRAAVQRAGSEFDVYVFTDSDGRPGRGWLKRLVAPLADPNLGAVTTFRWLFPRRGGFWTALASAWNAPVVTYLGDHGHNFCWGGGTAIRRERFEQSNVFEFWNGSVSDDLSLTHALRAASLPIQFAPECLVPSTIDCNAASLLEFTNRQMIITRVYEPGLWSRAGMGHVLYCGAILLGLVLYVANTISGAPAIHLLLLAFVPPVLSMARGVLRLAAVMELLPEWKTKLLADSWIWTFLAAAAPFLALWNTLVALFNRKIQWRGLRYQLLSPGQTRILVR
jgi:ceramide glucosyltransferase